MLGCATVLGMIGLVLAPLLQSSCIAHLTLIIRIFALLVIAGGLYFLVPPYGATGAALAILGSALVSLAILLATGFREIGKMKQRS